MEMCGFRQGHIFVRPARRNSPHVSLHNREGRTLSAQFIFLCQKNERWNSCRLESNQKIAAPVASGFLWGAFFCDLFADTAPVHSVGEWGEAGQRKM
jgi:hypothetical protein